MEMRRLGRSDLRVAPLALGGNVFGWTADEAASFAVLDAFVDAGFNLIDTADTCSRWVPGATGSSGQVAGRRHSLAHAADFAYCPPGSRFVGNGCGVMTMRMGGSTMPSGHQPIEGSSHAS